MPKGSASSPVLEAALFGRIFKRLLIAVPLPAFKEVSRQVEERSGFSLSWTRSAKEQLDCILEETLQRELSLEDAVCLALLNNRHLQGIYESLGIAQAELVQAGLFQNPLFDLSFKYHEGFGSRKIVELGGSAKSPRYPAYAP